MVILFFFKIVCTLPKEEGLCYKALKRWYYNATKMKCEQIIFRGCKGNKNRFRTKNRCLKNFEGRSKF